MSDTRIRGRKLQKIRRDLYAENPECTECGILLTSDVEWHVDHIIALSKGGKDVPENRQILCLDCHDTKTAQDLGHKNAQQIGDDGWPIEEPRRRGVSFKD